MRIEGIDPERAYTAKEIKALQRARACAPRQRRWSSSKSSRAGSRGRPPARIYSTVTIKGKPAIFEYEPDTDLRDTEQVPLASRRRN